MNTAENHFTVTSHAAAPGISSACAWRNVIMAAPHARRGLSEFAQQEATHYPLFFAKSWISLNWIRGCPLGCAYCYRRGRDGTAVANPTFQVYDEEFVVEYLLNHPYFVPALKGKKHGFPPSPLGLHTSTTDPFIPEVKAHTFKMLRLLDRCGLENSVVIISKWYLDDDEVAELEQEIRNLNIFIAVCYSGLPAEVEPVTDPAIVERKRHFMQRLARSSSIRVIHYMRPIGLGWNDDQLALQRALQFGAPAAAMVMGGVTLWDEELAQLKELDVPLPKEPPGGWRNYGYRRKYLPKELEQQIIAQKNELGIAVPIFRRASCSFSYIQRIPDYNAYRTENKKYCTTSCPAEQKCRCDTNQCPSRDRVRDAMAQMNLKPRPFEIRENEIRFSPEDRVFGILDAFNLRHMLKFPVTVGSAD